MKLTLIAIFSPNGQNLAHLAFDFSLVFSIDPQSWRDLISVPHQSHIVVDADGIALRPKSV